MDSFDKTVIIVAAVITLFFAFLGIGSPANLQEGKAVSEARWKEAGYAVVAYEGFQYGWWLGGCYGGAKVWSQLRAIPDNGIRYTGYLKKWCDDGWQIYNITAIDAIKP